MRNLSKAKLQSFHRNAKELIHEYGGIHNSIKPSELGYDYVLETKAGMLGITLHEDSDLEGTAVFSIFCRFLDVDKAKEVLQGDDNLNKFSGKWNFHYLNEGVILARFDKALKDIVSDKPITKYDELVNYTNHAYEVPNTLLINDEIREGRLNIDEATTWDWKSGMAICCDGSTSRIMKKTQFQLWIKGDKV